MGVVSPWSNMAEGPRVVANGSEVEKGKKKRAGARVVIETKLCRGTKKWGIRDQAGGAVKEESVGMIAEG